MEQITQQITQKPSLPTKTKIAARWIIVIGLIVMIWGGLIMTIWDGYLIDVEFFDADFFLRQKLFIGEESGALIFFANLSLLIFVYFLLMCKRWAWWILVVGDFILMIFGGLYFFMAAIFPGYLLFFTWVDILFSFIIPTISVVPFVLLLLDRKNFWKIAS